MAPKAQKEPSWIGGPTKGLGVNEYTNLRPARASKELKYWFSWPQDYTALTPSVKRPLYQMEFLLVWNLIRTWLKKHFDTA